MPVGQVEIGVIKAGMVVTFAPAAVTTEIKSIEMHNETLEQGNPGDNIGFTFKNVFVKDIRRGNVCSSSKDDPDKEAKSLNQAQVIVLNEFITLTDKSDKRSGKKIEIQIQKVKSGLRCWLDS